MTVRRLVLLATALCALVVVAAVVVLNRSGDDTPEAPTDEKAKASEEKETDLSQPPYAYLTQNELVVMRGKQRLTSVARVFDVADPLWNRVVWTHSGTYVAVLRGAQLMGQDMKDEELLFVDTRTGADHAVPCPYCTWIAAVGDDEVLAAPGPDNLLEFDLTKPDDQPLTKRNTVPDREFLNLPLTSSRHHLLMAEQTSRGNNDYGEQVTLAGTDESTPKNLGFYDSNSYMPAAALSGADASADRFAFAARNNPGGCASAFPVYVATPDGEATEVDVLAATPPDFVPNEKNGVEVQDLWWSEDGVLHATMTSWTCDESHRDEQTKKIVHSPPTLWQVKDNAWIQEDTTQAAVNRRLPDNSRIMLRITDCTGDLSPDADAAHCNTGTLDLATGGDSTRIADEVLAVHTPPPTNETPPTPSPSADTDRLLTADVPSLCDHPAGTLVNGEHPDIPTAEGFVALKATLEPESAADLVATADLTGDGNADTVAVFACSGGGVGLPNNLVLWDHDMTVLGEVDLGDVTPAEHSEVRRIHTDQNIMTVEWTSYEGANFCMKAWTAQVTWHDGVVSIADLTQVGTTGPGC